MKIVTIIGARPQFVKAAVVSRAIKEHNLTNPEELIEEIIVHTGQHFDGNMSTVFFDQMEIPIPDYNLDINSLSHGAMTGQMLTKIEQVLLDKQPDWVLVYGDTNSTIAGALAAKKLHIKVAHVEAGLRSFNMDMPEEVNRIVTDRISDILFCPTQTAVDNLMAEGYSHMPITIDKCGDVMYDAALYYSDRAKKPQGLKTNGGFVLSTVHRQENTDDKDRLQAVFGALVAITDETDVVIPMHPRTVKKLKAYSMEIPARLKVLEPVGYFEMLWLLQQCNCVITDSGGLQKEAFFFKKPCITVRDETEWVELTQNKVNHLTGANKIKIVETFKTIANTSTNFDMDLYGQGDTGKKIVNQLMVFTKG